MQQIELLDLIIEPDKYTVSRHGNFINLPRLSFALFMYLVENAQTICTLEEISLAVWKRTEVSNETVIQRIRLLRKVLGDEAKSPRYIESVRGRGYRLIIKPVNREKTNIKPRQKKFFLVGIVTLTLIAVAIMIYRGAQQSQSNVSISSVKLRKETQLISPLLERGKYYFSIGQKNNLDRAIELFNEALELEPANVTALIGLSLALSKSVCRYNEKRSRAIKAKQFARQAINLDSVNSRAQAALAYSWDCLGNLELALEHYLLSIKLDPQNFNSISSAAYLLEVKGQLLAAFKLNKQAKQLKPDNYMVDLQIAHTLELLKFTTQAQASYERLFVLFPDNVFVNEAYPRFLFYQGRFSQAKNVIKKVLKREVERVDVFLYYAELLWLLEGKQKALPWFRRAAEVNPNQSYAKTLVQIMDNQLTSEKVNFKTDQLEKMVAEGNTWPDKYVEASIMSLLVLKNKERAISYLQKAVNSGYLNSEYLAISPLFAQLGESPEFYQLIDDINRRRESMQKQFLAEYPPPVVQ